jgi:transketolase C-terminal domain/subunit
MDHGALLDMAKVCKNVFIVEDHVEDGGLMDAVSRLFLQNKITPGLFHIGLKRKGFQPALLPDVLLNEGLDADSIVVKVTDRL